MNVQKFLIATVVATVVLFVIDYLWFGLIFKDWFAAHMPPQGDPADMHIATHLVGEICLAALLAYIYPLGYKGGSPVSQGIMFGILMGLVYALPGSIHMSAGMEGAMPVACFFIAHGLIAGILGGLAVAMVYGSNTAKA